MCFVNEVKSHAVPELKLSWFLQSQAGKRIFE